jgi:hypothetical protein
MLNENLIAHHTLSNKPDRRVTANKEYDFVCEALPNSPYYTMMIVMNRTLNEPYFQPYDQ